MSQEADETFDHWVTRLNKKMRLCDYRFACDVKDCNHNHNYGNILVEEAMIANMYDQDQMTRIMSDHKATNTYELKYEMAMNMMESGECAKELEKAPAASHKRSEYKAQQAAGQRGGATSKKFESGSEGKCAECKKTFENVILVRGKQMKIKKCQTCFEKSIKCTTCKETGHRPRHCKKSANKKTREELASETDSSSESESDQDTRASRTKSSKSGKSSYSKSTTFLRRSRDEAQKSDRGARGNQVIVSNLEWTGTKFEERRPEKQPKVKARMSVMPEAMKS